jgi:hypothetical protein
VGIAVLLVIAFFLLGLISDLVIPLVFAAILAAIFVPLVDRLERWRVPRWLGAPLVVLLVIGVVSVVAWVVVAGLVGQPLGWADRHRDLRDQLLPFFGAFFAGAFAVVIARGAKGAECRPGQVGHHLAGQQHPAEPAGAGGLRQDATAAPLVVLLVTTAGTLLFGVLGATLAAPITAVTLRTVGLLGDAGLFDVAATSPAATAEVPSSLDGREASAGSPLPE